MSESVPHSPLALIGDAHEWSARSLDSILTPKGYSVLRTSTGTELLEHAPRVQPDLVILDLTLPEAGGIELCRELRSSGAISPATPVLITSSGPVTRDVRVAALRAGAWECASFPLDAEVLLLKLDAFRRAKRYAGTGARGPKTSAVLSQSPG